MCVCVFAGGWTTVCFVASLYFSVLPLVSCCFLFPCCCFPLLHVAACCFLPFIVSHCFQLLLFLSVASDVKVPATSSCFQLLHFASRCFRLLLVAPDCYALLSVAKFTLVQDSWEELQWHIRQREILIPSVGVFPFKLEISTSMFARAFESTDT